MLPKSLDRIHLTVCLFAVLSKKRHIRVLSDNTKNCGSLASVLGLHNSEHPHPVFPPQLASFEL